MAENKRYYWLKLKEGFFGEKEVKKLRQIAGGDTYTIIYLKLMLLSLRENGKLYYDGIEDTFYEELALEIDENADNVKVTLIYLARMGLMEEISPTESFLTQIPECVGSETQKAELMRKSRARKKALENGNIVTTMLPPVTNRYPDIEINKEINQDIEFKREDKSDEPISYPPPPKPTTPKPVKHKHGEYQNVRLTDEEVLKLQSEYGDRMTKEAITYLDEYIEYKGYKAKSHYLAIRKWVVDAVNEKVFKRKKANNQNTGSMIGTYDLDAFERMLDEKDNLPPTAAEDENIRARAEALQKELAGKN